MTTATVKPGMLAEHAPRIAQVLSSAIDEARPTFVAARFLDLLHAAEFRAVLRLDVLQMELQLVGEIALLAAGAGEFVELRASIVFCRVPAGLDPSAPLESMERRVEGALRHLQLV
jgi:hypothetical protein